MSICKYAIYNEDGPLNTVIIVRNTSTNNRSVLYRIKILDSHLQS